VYFNVKFNVFFELIKVHLLLNELYIYQNERCNDRERERERYKLLLDELQLASI
jgi:hypothetical protein